jgi:hypothetical protein
MSGAVIWPVHSAADDIAKARADRSKEIRETQMAHLSLAAAEPTGKAHVPVSVALETELPVLQKKAPGPSAAVVPGSATALKALQVPAIPPPAPVVSPPSGPAKPAAGSTSATPSATGSTPAPAPSANPVPAPVSTPPSIPAPAPATHSPAPAAPAPSASGNAPKS